MNNGGTTGPESGETPAGVSDHSNVDAGSGPAAPSSASADAATGNPFADMKVGDLIRDAVALALLLISFGMPWDALESSTGRLYVVFATLISIASLALPYLRRGGILPEAWSDNTVRGARLIANVPYAIVVVLTLVLGYVGEGVGDSGRGIGIGVAFGTARADLAAQPRTSERASEVADAGLWRLTVAALGGLIAVLTVVSLVFFLVDADGAEWADIDFVIAYMLFFAAVALLPVAAFLGGKAPSRDVLIVLGAVGVLAGFWMLGGAAGNGAWLLRFDGPTMLFWPALAAAASAASLPSVLPPEGGSARWIGLPVRLFRLLAIAGGGAAVLAAVTIARDDSGRGTEITLLVVLLLLVVAALIGRNALVANARTGRATALVVAGAFVVFGIVYAAVAANSDPGFNTLAAVVVSLLFVFAAAIGYALLVPAAVRADLGPVGAVSPSFLRSSKPTEPGSGAGNGVAGTGAAAAPASSVAPQASDPATTVVGGGSDVGAASSHPAEAHPQEQRFSSSIGPEDATRVQPRVEADRASGPADTVDSAAGGAVGAGSGFTAEQAADPSTPLQVLADIAAAEPGLRPHIASNPSTYPELLDWLAQLGDPDVNEALHRRGHA